MHGCMCTCMSFPRAKSMVLLYTCNRKKSYEEKLKPLARQKSEIETKIINQCCVDRFVSSIFVNQSTVWWTEAHRPISSIVFGDSTFCSCAFSLSLEFNHDRVMYYLARSTTTEIERRLNGHSWHHSHSKWILSFHNGQRKLKWLFLLSWLLFKSKSHY